MSNSGDNPILKNCCCGLLSLRGGSVAAIILTLLMTSSQLAKEFPLSRTDVKTSKIPIFKTIDGAVENVTGRNNASKDTDSDFRSLTTFTGPAKAQIAQKCVDMTWTSAGILASALLAYAVIRNHQAWMLPWLSWTSINLLLVSMNLMLFLAVIGIDDRSRQQLPFTYLDLIQYVSIPIQFYLILVVIAYYQTLEHSPRRQQSLVDSLSLPEELMSTSNEEDDKRCQGFIRKISQRKRPAISFGGIVNSNTNDTVIGLHYESLQAQEKQALRKTSAEPAN